MDFKILELVHEPTILIIAIFLVLIIIVNTTRLNKLENKVSDLRSELDKLRKEFEKHVATGDNTRKKVDALDKYMQKHINYEIIKQDDDQEKMKDKALNNTKVANILDPRGKETEDNK